ncbi:MAG: polysaccharide deacetylase family protein [Alcanivoracaceae bacterium]|nr:polysaccharide deacetylase family protein [Alcanivoracaceae bacterium]
MFSKLMKTVMCLLCLAAGAARAGSILMYHHVSETTPAATSVSPDTFARHLQLLEDNAFAVVPLTDLVARVAEGLPHDRQVAITFDDGYASIAEHALPLLDARGWKAAIFVSVDQIGGASMMDLDTLRAAARRGHRILNHGFSHDHMVRQSVARSVADVARAQAFLASHFDSPRYLAWPYGESSPELERALASEGYLAFAQHTGAVHADMNWQAIPRIAVNQRYAAWEPLYDKLMALPLPVQASSPASGITTDRRPWLELLLPADWDRPLNCFVGGEPVVPLVQRREQGLQVRLRAAEPLAPGRHRYTCTAAAQGQRYHWFSWLWMIRDGDQWYAEP